MASPELPIDDHCAREALTTCTEDICRKINFDEIKPAAVSERIVQHEFLDMMKELPGNSNRMMEFLRNLKQTNLADSFIPFVFNILPKTIAGEECRDKLLEEYEKVKGTLIIL